MTIPESVIQRAVSAVLDEWVRQDCHIPYKPELIASHFLIPALPILRAAIREELVQEMIADVEQERWHQFVDGYDQHSINAPTYDGADIEEALRHYLPESETTS